MNKNFLTEMKGIQETTIADYNTNPRAITVYLNDFLLKYLNSIYKYI